MRWRSELVDEKEKNVPEFAGRLLLTWMALASHLSPVHKRNSANFTFNA